MRQKYNIPEHSFVFFTPARLTEVKGLIPFYQNAAPVLGNTSVVSVIAGTGPLKLQLEALAKEKKMDVRVLEYQSQENVRDYLALADAFLLPSLSDPNPLSAIEAAWAGLPLVVSCYVGNHPELVDPFQNGVVFDTLNAEDVCSKINFVLSQNQGWLKEAGTLSLQKAQQDFDSDVESRKFLHQLKLFLNAGKGEHT